MRGTKRKSTDTIIGGHYKQDTPAYTFTIVWDKDSIIEETNGEVSYNTIFIIQNICPFLTW